MPADAPPNPRAFATTTGFLFQIVGAVYMLIAAVYGLASSCLQQQSGVPIDSVAAYFDEANVLNTITTVNVLAGLAGGLAMFTFGLGLQGERPRSGLGAMITTAALVLSALGSAILYALLARAWLHMSLVAVFAAVNTVLFLLAGHSAALLRRYPPPKDQNIVTDAWLEEHARNRKRL